MTREASWSAEALLSALIRPKEGTDFNGWLAPCEELELDGALFSAMRRARAELSEEETRRLEKLHRQNVATAMEQLHVARELSRSFDAAAIEHRFLKGTDLLLREVLRDPGARFSVDIDVLTHERDRRAALALLEDLGFRERPGTRGPKHLIPRVRGRVTLEVHEFAYWDKAGAPVTLARAALISPALAFTAVHLLHHMLLSSVVEPWLTIKTVLDFAELDRLERERPSGLWETTRGLASEAGLRAPLEDMLLLVRALASGAAIPPEGRWIIRLAEPQSDEAFRAESLRWFLTSLRRAPRWFARGLLVATLFPSRSSMAKITGLAASDPTLLLHYVARPLRLLRRGLGAWRGRHGR